jgi:glutaminyl-peptide cyclotransferase
MNNHDPNPLVLATGERHSRCGQRKWLAGACTVAVGLAVLVAACRTPSETSGVQDPSGPVLALTMTAEESRTLASGGARTKTGGTFKLIEVVSHDKTANTQGLEQFETWSAGPTTTTTVLESTGGYGKSSLRQVNAYTGEVLNQYNLPAKYFGRGVTYVPSRNGIEADRFIQLTWREKTGLVIDPYTFDLMKSFPYTTTTGKGWGIAYRGTDHSLLVTDGSALLHTWDANTFKEKLRPHTILTRQPKPGSSTMIDTPIKKIFDLEWDAYTDTVLGSAIENGTIVRIDPKTGLVTNVYDVSSIYPNRDPAAGPLNGIALANSPRQIWVTGKSWPKMYRIELID